MVVVVTVVPVIVMLVVMVSVLVMTFVVTMIVMTGVGGCPVGHFVLGGMVVTAVMVVIMRPLVLVD